jgi:hypothetical protein
MKAPFGLRMLSDFLARVFAVVRVLFPFYRARNVRLYALQWAIHMEEDLLQKQEFQSLGRCLAELEAFHRPVGR